MVKTLFTFLLLTTTALAQLGQQRPGFSGGMGGVGFSSPSGVSYLLNDQFTTDRAAGSVNGTAAEPTGGVRTVTDGNSKLSISSGLLSYATGGVGAGDPGIWYASTARTAGKLYHARVSLSGTTNAAVSLGWDSNTSGGLLDAVQFAASGVINHVTNGATAVAVGTYTATDYNIINPLRATGNFLLVKGGAYTNWSLVGIGSAGTTTPVYPAAIALGTTSVATVDNIRVPQTLWLPTPLVSDGFGSAFGTSDGLGHAEGIAGGLGAGGGSQTWTGSTWSVSGGKAVNTPTLGAEQFENTGFDTDTYWTKGSGWTIAGGVANFTSTGASTALYRFFAPTGVWFRIQNDLLNASNGGSGHYLGNGFAGYKQSANGTYVTTGRSVGAAIQGWGGSGATGVPAFDIDNGSLKPLTLSELFATVNTTTPNVIVSADVVIPNLSTTNATQAGLVLNLDNTANPQNFVIAYIQDFNGVKVFLEKCVAGTYTTLINTAATYSAGATLRVIKDGNNYDVYYNNAKVGSTQTISDAGIVSNTRHGLFSTHSANTLDNFTVYARGTEGQYSNLNVYTQ